MYENRLGRAETVFLWINLEIKLKLLPLL